jgi:spermidine/putrescine-binding protein
MGPFVRTSKAAKLELRWLGWEHYNVKKLTAKFEKQYNCKVSAGFFDGNSGTQKHTTSCVEEG